MEKTNRPINKRGDEQWAVQSFLIFLKLHSTSGSVAWANCLVACICFFGFGVLVCGLARLFGVASLSPPGDVSTLLSDSNVPAYTIGLTLSYLGKISNHNTQQTYCLFLVLITPLGTILPEMFASIYL